MEPCELHDKKMPQGMGTTKVNKRLQRSPLMRKAHKKSTEETCAMINCRFQFHSLKLQSNALLQEKFFSKLVALVERIKIFTPFPHLLLSQEITNSHILKIFTCFTATMRRQAVYSSPPKNTLGRRAGFRPKGFQVPHEEHHRHGPRGGQPIIIRQLPINPVRSSHSPSPRWIARVSDSIFGIYCPTYPCYLNFPFHYNQATPGAKKDLLPSQTLSPD